MPPLFAAVTAALPAASTLSTAATVIGAAGTVLSVASGIAQGNAAAKSAEYEAQQLESRAKNERASAQRAAIMERRKADYLSSAATARAAASGAGALDPSVANVIGDIQGEGEYNALSALYNGEERARGSENSAVSARYSGRQARTAGYLNAAGSIVSGASTMFDRFGGDGFKNYGAIGGK